MCERFPDLVTHRTALQNPCTSDKDLNPKQHNHNHKARFAPHYTRDRDEGWLASTRAFIIASENLLPLWQLRQAACALTWTRYDKTGTLLPAWASHCGRM